MKGSSRLTIRHVGLNTPELPHFEIQAVPKKSENWVVEKMTLKKVKELAKTKTTVTYLKHPVDKDKTKVLERKDDEELTLLKMIDNKGKTCYKEIIDMSPVVNYRNSKYNYYTIVVEDNSTAKTIIDGYNCQKIVRETLSSATDILLVVNASGLSVGKKAPLSQMTFNSLYYVDDTIDFMLNEWKTSFGDVQETNFSYNPYGTDTYGRSLGAIYVREVVKGESRWINLNKKVLAASQYSEANPSYTSSPELKNIGAGLSDVFKTWSYDKNNFEYVDSFSSMTSKSYQKRINLHKYLTGIDFTESRNCALMIGDTMMLVPPESIRNITQVFYERLPNMRSKGTMTKQVGQNEQMLEVTLYFYEEAGINGIPYQVETPSGETLTYYMNGLRSLLAQFKLTPYLPIENGYINDVLGIEAVSMQNINIQTVEGFPRLLRVVLTLREFNYRTFMPDLPVDDNDSDDTARISELNPMFAKCFNWEIFRYYYQRAIIAGEDLKSMEFASYDYNLQFYTHKNTLQPFYFCSPPGMGSKISFYIPDEIWLQNALQVKKARESTVLTDTASVEELSDNAKKFCANLSTLFSRIKKLNEVKDASKFRNALSVIFQYSDSLYSNVPLFAFNTEKEDSAEGERKVVKRKGISEANGDDTTLFMFPVDMTKDEIKKQITVIRNAFFDGINDASYMTGLNMDETIFWNNSQKAYEVC